MVMCSVYWKAFGLNIATIGSMSTGRPFTCRKPVDEFIQALTSTTKCPKCTTDRHQDAYNPMG